MDTTAPRAAYHDFLAVDANGRFERPPAGEWTAEQLLAHVVATDTGIAAVALGVAAGQRPTYDDRYALDGWNLARLARRRVPDWPAGCAGAASYCVRSPKA